jgi:hypothetical protein
MTWHNDSRFIVDVHTLYALLIYIENKDTSSGVMKTLGEHPNFSILTTNTGLREKLKHLLACEIAIIEYKTKYKNITTTMMDERNTRWQEYELLRRLYCWNNESLIIYKS